MRVPSPRPDQHGADAPPALAREERAQRNLHPAPEADELERVPPRRTVDERVERREGVRRSDVDGADGWVVGGYGDGGGWYGM